MHKQRISRISCLLKNYQAYLTADNNDIFYLTGFPNSDIVLIIAKERLFFILPDMLKIQFRTKFPNAIILDSKNIKKSIRQIKYYGVKDLLINPRKISCWFFDNIEDKKEFNYIFKLKNDPVDKLRIIKDEFEIANIRKACDITLKTFKWVRKIIKPGMKESQISGIIKRKMLDLGADGFGFEPIVAADINSSMPHYVSGECIINRNSVILLDFGCTYMGYNSDLTRMVFLGKMQKLYIKINKIVFKAYNKALARIKPGVGIFSVDKAARNVIKRAGYGRFFNHSLGHGVGIQVHELPGISAKSNGRLKRGMVITAEPGIYIPGFGGVRYEDTVLVTEKGYKILTS